MQGEEWAGRQEGGGEEEAEKPGDVTVKGNTTVIQVVLITYLKLIGVNIIFHKLIALRWRRKEEGIEQDSPLLEVY